MLSHEKQKRSHFPFSATKQETSVGVYLFLLELRAAAWFQLVALGRLGHLIPTDSWELVCTSCSIQLLPQMLAAKAFPLGEMPRGLLHLCNNFLY